MSGSKPVRYGLSVTGLALAVVSVIVSCTDAPVSPKPEGYSIRAPLALVGPVFSRLQFLDFVKDDAGANDTPAQSDLNAFTRADNLPDTVGVKWVWDDVDSWTGSGQTGDACALFDTDNDSKANAAVCVRISNPGGDPTVIAQLALPASPLVYSCGDTKNDRCTQSASRALSGTVCEVEKITGETFFTAGEDGADVLAACSIPLSAISASVTPNLLNVCSYPSGSPNSNPFDCVVTPGAGFLVIKKATSPQSSGLTFNFKVLPKLVSDSLFSITDNSSQDEATALLAATPGNYSVTEGTLSAGWALDSAACVQGTTNTSTGTKSGSTVSGVAIASGKTTTCRFVNKVVAPSITVVKTATPNSIRETGDSVSYSVVVTNGASIAVTLDSIKDNVFGNLSGQGSCGSAGNPYGSIAASGGTYSCSFKKLLAASDAGLTHINQVTSYVSSAGGPASASDTAKVTYTDVLPDISVTKSADYVSITATGGDSVSNFAQDVRFVRGSGGGGGGQIFVPNICDDRGVNDINAAQNDLNCFSRADNISGHIGLRWSWDAVAQWTGSGQTGDACALLDTDNSGSANYALCVRIQNPGGDPNAIAQIAGSPVLYKCGDKTPDRCSSQSSVLVITNSTCGVSRVPNRMVGGDDGDDIEAVCDVDLHDLANNIVIANVDLLNVCSFPSGSPGSNAFDCVVTPASGFLVLVDSTTSASDAYFGFTLRNATNTAPDTATNGDDKWEVQARGTSPGLPIPAGNHSIVQSLPTNWTLVSVTCVRDGNTVGTSDLANLARLNIPIVAGQTTRCTFVNTLAASQTVTFTVTVTNNSLESVNLFSLEDSENPDAGTPTYSTLSGSGTCNSGANPYGAIASGGTYVCTFTRTVSGAPGTQHKDKVRAVGKDNELNPDTEISNTVTVSIN